MNRRTFLIGAASAAACRSGPRLNVFNWSDYVAPDTIPNFEREFGLRVRYGTYESIPEMLAKVMSGNSGWDVVFPSGEYIQPMRDMGLLARLNHAWMPNLSNLDRPFQQPPWDPGLEWSVPYMHGTTGIVYQKSLGWPLRAWSDLWDRRLAGKLTMLDDPPEVFAACLETLGDSINSSDRGQLESAQQRAIAQKPLVRAYLNAEVRDQLVAGDVAVAQAWAVTAAQAIAAAPDRLAFAFPAEGFPRYADNVAILRESSRHGSRAPLHRLPAAAEGGCGHRRDHAHGYLQRRGPKHLTNRAAFGPGALSAGGNPGARRMVRAAIGRRAAPARPPVDRNQGISGPGLLTFWRAVAGPTSGIARPADKTESRWKSLESIQRGDIATLPV